MISTSKGEERSAPREVNSTKNMSAPQMVSDGITKIPHPNAEGNGTMKHTFEKKGDWSMMSAARWHDSMYYEGSYFQQLFRDTQVYTRRATAIYCGSPARCSLVEVGSGTGDVLLSLAADFRYSLGLDINDAFLQYAEENTPQDVVKKVSFCRGSATELIDIVSSHPEAAQFVGPTVVTCVNNTLGVFPDAIKPRTYSQMKELAGDQGIIIVGFWNGNKFGEALQYFYHKHPELCGSMKGAKIDFEDRHLDTAEGYHTHWTTPEEARKVLESSGFHVLDVTEIGVGVLCTCSSSCRAPSPAGTVASPRANAGTKDALTAEIEAQSMYHYSDSFSQYFYGELWGGRHQHLGLYEDPVTLALNARERVVQACEDSSVVLFSLAKPTMCTKAVELGSGYGAGARYLAANFGAAVDCVDLSPEANALNRRYTEDAELSHLVHVLPPSTFFGTHLNTGAYGFCFSQDALCHAGKQTPVVLEEAARLLSSDSTFACSNILRSQEATLDELEGVYARLQLTYLETFESFVEHADAAGFDLVESLDKTSSMATHFQSLLEVADMCKHDMVRDTSEEYMEKICEDMKKWQVAASKGTLRWAFFVFKKRTP